jgi:hypothetical protein
MGVYRQLMRGNKPQVINHKPAFVGGRCDDMVLYFNKDDDDDDNDGGGWFVTHEDKDVMLWSASIGALPHLTKSSWVVFDPTKVPAPSFRIRKFKNRETLLEVAGEQGSMFGEMVAGNYKTRTHIHDGKSTYACDKRSKVIWFKEGFGWCIGIDACIGTRVCLFHASDFAPTPDEVQSIWTKKADPAIDPRVKVVLASAEPSRSPAGQQALLANNAALQVAVVGMTDGYNGLYKKMQRMVGNNALYKCTAANGNSVVWYNMDHEEWCIGAEGSNGRFGCVAFAADSAAASSPLASELTWYEPAWDPCSTIRVTKSKKKHTKVIEVKGVPTDELALAVVNGKYRQQALVVDGKPTFKGGQDSNHMIWYSERAGEWRIGELGLMGTSAHLVHAEDTAATPNTVKTTWYAPLGTSNHSNLKVILPSVKAVEQEVPRQMQLKIPQALAAEEKRCLGCGHQYTAQTEVVFHEECMHHHCVCCQEGLRDAECAVCMEE